MHSLALERFSKDIFGITHGTKNWEFEPQVLITLRQQAAALCEAYAASDPSDTEVQRLGLEVEGCLLGCQTVEALSEEQVGVLIGELHSLLGRAVS